MKPNGIFFRIMDALVCAGLVVTTSLAQGGEAEKSGRLTLDGDGGGAASGAGVRLAQAEGQDSDADPDREAETAAREPFAESAWPPDFGTPSGSELDKPPQPKDEEERRILSVLEEMSQGDWHANVSPTDGRFLRLLTEATGAERVVEIGTSNGYSGIWIALALRKTGGELVTHEIDPERIEMARENFEKAGVGELITVIEGDAHETVEQHEEPIDILFLDADKQGYIDYLEKLSPLIRPGGLIVAHNMRVPSPDPRYIETITSDPELETLFLLMHGAGMGVTLKKR